MKRIILLLLVPCLVGGCGNMKPKTRIAKRYRVGGLINAVAKNISRKGSKIRCKGGNIVVKLPKEEGGRKIDLDGVVILYEYPKHLYFSGSLLGKPRLIIGSNYINYWIEILHDPSELRWGSWSETDKRRGDIQFDPQCFLEALGDVNLRNPRYTGPFLDRRESENVLMYGQVDDDGEWYFAKKVHISKYEPVVIREIDYLDMRGTKTMVIKLSGHTWIKGVGYIARHVELYWPAQNSFMKVDLGDIHSVESLPKEAFEFPEKDSFDRVYSLD